VLIVAASRRLTESDRENFQIEGAIGTVQSGWDVGELESTCEDGIVGTQISKLETLIIPPRSPSTGHR